MAVVINGEKLWTLASKESLTVMYDDRWVAIVGNLVERPKKRGDCYILAFAFSYRRVYVTTN